MNTTRHRGNDERGANQENMKNFAQKFILNKSRNSKKIAAGGFTLVELLIVVVILGVLSGVALPNFLKQRDRAKVGAANAASAALITACEIAITNDEDATLDEDVVRLEAALPDDAEATATATLAATECSVAVTGTSVVTDGAFASFGEKTPAVAGTPAAG